MNPLYWQEDTSVAVLDEEIRVDKIREIRRQLAENRYDVAQRLDAVVDKVLDALNE